tara:strand:- start:282 stop:428 length:147 start_codon:yes stop_codon:yes gene_type:complete
MKSLYTYFIVLLFFGCSGEKYQYFDGTFEEAKAIADSKLILLKFYTNT